MPGKAVLTVLQLIQVGVLARETLRARVALYKIELRRRARMAALASFLGVVAILLFVASLFAALSSVVFILHDNGWSWPASFGLTAGGSLLFAVLLATASRLAFKRAGRSANRL